MKFYAVSRFLSTMRSRWTTLLSLMLITVATSALLTWRAAPTYESVARVMIDMTAPDYITGRDLHPGFILGYIDTQIGILTNRQTAGRVVDQLKMVDSFRKANAAKPKLAALTDREVRERMIDTLLKALDAKPDMESNIVDLRVKTEDAQESAAVANAFAAAYLEATSAAAAEPSRRALETLKREVASAQARVNDEKNKLLAYQRKFGITSTDEWMEVDGVRLQQLSRQLTRLESLATESSQRQQAARASLRDGGGAMPEAVADQSLQAMKVQLARLQARADERAAVLGANHPEMLALNTDIEGLRNRINNETASLANSLQLGDRVNQQSLAEARAAYQQQLAKVVGMREQHNEMLLLQRDVNEAQRGYELVRERLDAVVLRGNSTHSNNALVDTATAAIAPSGPVWWLNLSIAALLGLFLSIGAALGIEASQRRVRTAEDLSVIVGVPVIATVSRPKSRRDPRRTRRYTGTFAGFTRTLGNSAGAQGK